MRRLGTRYQRTLQRPVVVTGQGYLTGAQVRLRFRPAPANLGVIFQRVDRPGRPMIPARVENVTGASRRTTLGTPPAQVELIEHVMAALHGLRIDNCIVEVNAPETPGLDGSARGFADALLHEGGTVLQNSPRDIWTVTEPVTVTDGKGMLTLYPAEREDAGLQASYLLDYGPTGSIGQQRHSHVITPEGFVNGLAECRTFLLEAEAEALRQQGLGSNTTPADLLVFGPRGPIGNTLRYANEPARHKVLDIVGDLGLFGRDLRGHVVGNKSGHALNVALVKELCQALARRNGGYHERAA